MSTFSAMGVEVVVGGASVAEVEAVERLFETWDGVFSRFRAASELSRVNRTPASAVFVSPLFARAVGLALTAADETGDLVDPTLGGALEALGYDRDFSRIRPSSAEPGKTAPARRQGVSLTGRLLVREPGIRLDLNGVVKALAVDEALGLLAGDGFVAAGGDVAVRGSVVVGLPGGGSLQARSCGIATSGSARRHWLRGGDVQHHLLDPRTGMPAASRWTQVTVAAPSCLAADVAAKAAFLLSEGGPDWLDARSLPGRFLEGEDAVVNETWRQALEPDRAAA